MTSGSWWRQWLQYFSITLVLLPSSLGAQTQTSPPGETFTLAAALAAMRAQHPALATAGGSVRAAEGDLVAARLWTNPVVSALFTRSVQNNSYDPAGYFSVGVSQFIELGGVPAERGRAAWQLARAAHSQLEDIGRELSYDLESAMIHMVAAQQHLGVAEQIRAMLAGVLRIIDDRVAAGSSPRYDATRIHTAVALAQADLDSARAEVYRARGDFAAAVGPGVVRLRGEADYPLDEPYPISDLASLEASLANRPDIRAANQRAAAADAAIRVARRSVLPGVNLQLSGGFGQSPGQVDLGVGLSVPLPVIDRGQGTIRAASARAESARAFASGLQSLEILRLRGLFAEAQQRREALVTFRSVAPSSSTEALAEARVAYVNGRFSVLELADAYSSWRDTRQREIDLVEATRQTEINVARVAGLQR